MSIWSRPLDLLAINSFNKDTLVSHLGIEMTGFGDNYLEAKMPVDSRTVQPFRLLHGGASCVLAESLGSIAANLTLNDPDSMAVGQHIEATHLKSASSGFVTGRAIAVHLGKSSQMWRIEIYSEDNKLLCDSKLLIAIVKKR